MSEIDWQRTLTREMSLFSIWYAFESYTNTFRELYDFSFSNIFYLNDHGKIISYKDGEELQQLMERIAEMCGRPGEAGRMLREAKAIAEELEGLIVAATDKEEEERLFRAFHALYPRFWAYYLFHFYLSDAVGEANVKNILGEDMQRFLSLRKTNPYLDIDRRFIRRFLRRIAPHDEELLPFLLPEEILAHFQGKKWPTEAKLEQRKERALLLSIGGKRETLTGAGATHRFKELVQEERVVSERLRGQTAQPGKAWGAARVVTRKEEFGKIEKGDILIAHMTTTDYTPYLAKVAAIITDEGGMMCHAAVIARELQKPCVIGTGNATTVLKDGDLVEVDADKGIVRKVG